MPWKAALRGADLTRRLLAFRRRQPSGRRSADINEVMGAIVRLLARTLGENIFNGARPERLAGAIDPGAD